MDAISKAVALNTSFSDVFIKPKDFLYSGLNGYDLYAFNGDLVTNFPDYLFQFYFDKATIAYAIDVLFKYFYDSAISFDAIFADAISGFGVFADNNKQHEILEIAKYLSETADVFVDVYGKDLLNAKPDTIEYNYLIDFVGISLFFSQFAGLTLYNSNFKFVRMDSFLSNQNNMNLIKSTVDKGKYLCDVCGIIDMLQKSLKFGMISKYGHIMNANTELTSSNLLIVGGNLDFHTYDTIWMTLYDDEKKSVFSNNKYPFNNQKINELLVTYLLCKEFDWCSDILYIGFFNLYNGSTYRYPVLEIPIEVLRTLNIKVIYQNFKNFQLDTGK